MRPYTCRDQLGEGEVATWAPSSSTLISGPPEGILMSSIVAKPISLMLALLNTSAGVTDGGHLRDGDLVLLSHERRNGIVWSDFTDL
jgi:hypothetical protein